MGKILLEGMDFYSFHGVYPEERKIGGHYKIDLTLEFYFGKVLKSDDLADTIDYSSVYRVVEEEMKIPSKLIEHLAARIIDRIMEKFETIQNISIKLSKINPPMKAKLEAVSVLLEKER